MNRRPNFRKIRGSVTVTFHCVVLLLSAFVAIKDARFVRVGEVEGKGKSEIDSKGKYVASDWMGMMDQPNHCLHTTVWQKNPV